MRIGQIVVSHRLLQLAAVLPNLRKRIIPSIYLLHTHMHLFMNIFSWHTARHLSDVLLN